MIDDGVNMLGRLRDERGMVEVLFGRTPDEAAACRDWLVDHNVPAILERTKHGTAPSGVAVLVPPDRLVEATELLAIRGDDDDDEEEGGGSFDSDDDDLNDDDDDDYDDDDDDDEDDYDDYDDDDEDDFDDEEEDET